jgi:hypothetical protein
LDHFFTSVNIIMANQYTPEEIQDIFDRYHEAINRGIPVTKELAEELADAKKGIKNYTFTLNQSLKQLGQTTKQTIGNIANGAKGVSVFNDNLSAAADTASVAAASFGPLGVAVGLVIKALTFFVITATKQSDKLFESFQSLSRSGSVGAQGMTDVFQSMKRFGYTIDELDKMTAVMAENSRNFAMFSGTAATGGKQLGELVDGFRDARVNLQALGLSTDEQVRAASGYYKQMGRLGRATEATSSGALAYIKEMETLTRLTGLQRADLEAQREAAEAIDAFQAALADAGPAAAKNMRETFDRLSAIDPEIAQGYAESVNGIITGSEAQMKYLRSTNFEGLEIAQRTTHDLSMTASKVGDSLADLYKGNQQLQRDFAKVGVDYFGKGRSHTILANKEFSKATGKATEEVEGLYAGMDAATRAQAEARVAQIDASNNMQSFVNMGVAPATQALAYLTQVVEKLTSILPGGKSKGYGQAGTGTTGGSLAATGAGAAAGAAAGSLLGPIGTAAGGIIGGLTGFAGYQMHGGAGGTTAGLRIKSGEATAGGSASENLYALAQRIQNELGGDLKHFSAFNDSYHQGTNSVHTQGRALDFTLNDPSKAAQVAAMIRGMPGVAKVLDEYTNPSSRATAGHIHAEINGAAGFKGALSGPMSGYKPNVLMHGNEELSIRPAGGSSNSNSGASEGTMMKLIERVDDLIYLNKSQLSAAEKMLKYQQ